MTVFLKLGEVTFANDEIPESINFGGDQSLSVKQLIGGKRVVNAMGRIDDDISWSGLFFGATATFRARFLDGMRILGNPLPLTWSQFNYIVVIKSFRAQFERTYKIPYTITVTVIQDLDKPLNQLFPVGYNDAILNQLSEAQDLATVISNPNITNSLAILATSLNNVSDFNILTDADLQFLDGQITAVLSNVSTAIVTASALI